MFGRYRPADAPDKAGHVPAGYVQEVGLVALPHAEAIARVDALQSAIGATLNGRHAGVLIGYDVGDPAVSLTGPVPGRPQPTAAMAAISRPSAAAAMPVANYSDLALTDASLDPYYAALWARLENR